mgnify:CR=1 FL=1
MSKIRLTSTAPGIMGLLESFPAIGTKMTALAQELLSTPHHGVFLPSWVLEYIAASCSEQGKTEFCRDSHYAIALAKSPHVSIADMHQHMLLNERYRLLELLAHKAYCFPGTITEAEITALQDDKAIHGSSTNEEIHLVIAIACAFRMFNAYVKNIGNPVCPTPEAYRQIGEAIASNGYQGV